MMLLIVANTMIHQGKYFPSGNLNILERFHSDQSFINFLDFYSSGPYWQKPVHLICNGNFFNLLLVDIYGSYPVTIDEWCSLAAIKKIFSAHPKLFLGLGKFLSMPNKSLSFIVGELDAGLMFAEVQQWMKEQIGANIDFQWQLDLGPVLIQGPVARRGRKFFSGPRGEKLLQLTLGQTLEIELRPIARKLLYPPLSLSKTFAGRWRMKILRRQLQIICNFAFSSFRNFVECCCWGWRKIFPPSFSACAPMKIGMISAFGSASSLMIDEGGRWAINLAGTANNEYRDGLWQYTVVEMDVSLGTVKNYALLTWKNV